MKLTNDEFEAVVYIFEKDNGNVKTDYEDQIISKSGLSDFDPVALEKIIVDGLNKGVYSGRTNRISAYWALGKRFNRELIPVFRKWLKQELHYNDPYAVYQLLITLGNMEEPTFNPDRDGSSAYSETQLNMRDAADYLKKNST